MESVLTTAVYLPKTADYVISYYSSTSSIDNSVLSIDNEALSTKSSLENWTESSVIHLPSGYHNITMSFPNLQAPKLIAISTESFERADQDSLSFNVKNSGNSEYTINIQNYSKPVFITLSEAYDNGWSAYVNGKELSHFFTYSFLNGFYMNNSGSDIIIRYNGQRYI